MGVGVGCGDSVVRWRRVVCVARTSQSDQARCLVGRLRGDDQRSGDDMFLNLLRHSLG